MSRKKLSVLFLTFNRLKLSSRYIPSLVSNLGDIDCEVLIGDNNSSDGTLDWACFFAHTCPLIPVRIFAFNENRGMESFNILAQESFGDYILKLDDDISAPYGFAQDMYNAMIETKEQKLLFLGHDMAWHKHTFASRSGMELYKPPHGKVVNVSNGQVFIHYNPSKWMVNGVCRLSRRDTFLNIGGHPKGIIYGCDAPMSRIAQRNGYWIGYYSNPNGLVQHFGSDTKEYRKFKDGQLHKSGGPRHV